MLAAEREAKESPEEIDILNNQVLICPFPSERANQCYLLHSSLKIIISATHTVCITHSSINRLIHCATHTFITYKSYLETFI